MVEHTRTLDFKIAFALGLGTMIAAGIFSLSGSAVFRIGSTAVVAFVLAALVAGITAAAYSEFASIYSENGGGYLFTSRTFENRDFLTYGVGATLFLGYTGTTAFYLATMDEWFYRFLIPESFHFLPHGTFGVLTALLLGALNARGTEESGAFQLIVTSAKVAVLLIFVGGMFAAVGAGPATNEFVTGFEAEPVDTVSVAALAFITFFGFSAIAASAGEIIEPRKTVPRAIAASIGTVTVLYALVIVAMVNITNVSARLDRSPEEILQLGETAMGAVAQAFIPITVAGVPVGEYLIVAGAIFSMVSASNASILAATGIGSLMGRQGQAPRRFSRIHREYGTPFWSVTAATVTITAFIVAFITLFSEEGVTSLHFLGLGALTGFATFNLLVPLAVVNGALIYSRRKFDDLERGFRMPLVPILPALGIIANLTLISNLPRVGVGVGIVVTLAVLGVYLVWGGAPASEELFEEVAQPIESSAPAEPPTSAHEEAEAAAAADSGAGDGDRYRVLVPVARPSRATAYVRLAAALGRGQGEDPLVQVLNVTQIPDQTPSEIVVDTARERAERIRGALADAEVDADYTVEGHISRDVAFDVVQTARDDEADLVLMGYPEAHPDITEGVEFDAPCPVLFASGVADGRVDLSVLNVGVGGGPHHEALVSLVDALGAGGAAVHLINVQSAGGGTDEDPGETLSNLPRVENTEVHNVSSSSVAEGLVSAAAENGGVLLVGASRNRRLKQWVLGSTPDRVVQLADANDVPVLVYTSRTGVPNWIEERLFPVYRYVRRLFGSDHTTDRRMTEPRRD